MTASESYKTDVPEWPSYGVWAFKYHEGINREVIKKYVKQYAWKKTYQLTSSGKAHRDSPAPPTRSREVKLAKRGAVHVQRAFYERVA